MSNSRPSPMKNPTDLIFRVGTSLIFVVGGLGHFVQDDVMMARFLDSPWVDLVNMFGDPLIMLYLSGAIMLIGGIMLLLGLFTRVSALALFLTLIPITFVIHIAPDHVGPLLKNIAILSSLVYFYVNGPGAYAFDNRLTPAID